MFTRKILILACLYFILAGLPFSLHAEGSASELFERFKQQVFQIRVIDVASGDKNSIGSGFQISSNGYLATNYHVVSSYVHEPEKFRLDFVAHDGSEGDVELHNIDIIHDLAILKITPRQESYFRFNLGKLSKGEQIYSMGNPHDLSMLIIEGNYNGLIQESRYKKILFSGSLNPGMSGGPAFDGQGRIIGINVAKGGEQLSFLVPVSRLESLYKQVKEHGPVDDYKQIISSALMDDQQVFYDQLHENEWETEELGEVLVSARLDESLKCWGHTIDEEDSYYIGVHKHCRSEDAIYVSNSMYTGGFSYDYEWISTDELNRFQFYSVVEDRYSHASAGGFADKDEVTNFVCEEEFVAISDHSWKLSTCMRAYKKYQGLHDVLVMLTAVDVNDKTLLAKATMTGVSKENSIRFIKRFLGGIEWKN